MSYSWLDSSVPKHYFDAGFGIDTKCCGQNCRYIQNVGYHAQSERHADLENGF
jgi:hypothetical protein